MKDMPILAKGYTIRMKKLCAKPTFLFPKNIVDKNEKDTD